MLRGRAAALTLIALLAYAPLLARDLSEPPAPGSSAGESTAESVLPRTLPTEDRVDVELRTVPFYVVDGDGQPVYDLRPEEIELVVEGEAFSPDTFDAYRLGGTASSESHSTAEREPAPGQPAPTYERTVHRHVFFLFDTAFSSARSLRRSLDAAFGLLQTLPESDRLYLILHHPEQGFRQELGPIAANPAGKEGLRQALEKLKPEIQRLQIAAEANLPPMSLAVPQSTVEGAGGKLGPGRNGTPAEQVHNAYEQVGNLGRTEYQSVAEQLAESYVVFAAALRQVTEPKVVLNFTGGIDDRLYFQGDVPFVGVGSTEAYLVDVRRSSPLVGRFQGPLTELAESGATFLFVNGAAEGARGAESLHHMGEVTGGTVIASTDAAILERRIAASTSAYYEAGFYSRPGDASRPDSADGRPVGVKVKVKRPGMRVVAPRRLESRLVYRSLTVEQRRLVIVDLVQRGAEGGGADGLTRASYQPPRMQLRPIEARLVGRSARRGDLVMEASWPEAMVGRGVDLYQVVLALRPGSQEAEIVRFDRQRTTGSRELLLLSAAPPSGDVAYVWGVVMVEPETGDTYFQRMMLQAPLQAASAGPAANP